MEEFKNKYDEALKRARKIHDNTEFDYEKGMMEEVFPELSESEDESMMKVLLRGFKNYAIVYDKFGGVDVSDIIAWLEKQKESVNHTKYDKKIDIGLFKNLKGPNPPIYL